MQTDAALRSTPIHAQGMRRLRARMVEQGGDWRDGPAVAAIAPGNGSLDGGRYEAQRRVRRHAERRCGDTAEHSLKARTNNDICDLMYVVPCGAAA